MASEASSTPKLLMLSPSPKLSPKPLALSSPPHQTSVSVPFLWEEEPGKPRPCTALITLPPHQKCLELPPRLQPMEYSRLITKTPSPTTVLDGPYMGKHVTYSSSFRIFSRSKRHDSFDYRFSGRLSPERVHIGALFLNEKKGKKGLFGKSRGQMQKSHKLMGTKQEFGEEGSFVISPSWDDVSQFAEEEDEKECDNNGTPTKVKMTSSRRNGSFPHLSHAKSHFWTTMCEGFKHAIPWKSRKSKKQVHIV
ncbi:DUF688 domain-containing protein [Heracleum sosnowskyi]|uniref:DUF688 domain-containing protein n=1 Tax=Heracleum sosnowskyi TaxID=360622 RepID=A0AAD8HAR1_9APIA|nr:DUF688 domain-containing protein [Heracleum sosnowskyi]